MHPLHQSTLAASTPIEPTKKSTLVEVLLMNLLDLVTNSRESMMIEGQDIPNLQGLGLEKCIGNPRLAVKATWRVADRADLKHHLLSIEMHLHLSHDSPSYHLRRRLRERSPRDRNQSIREAMILANTLQEARESPAVGTDTLIRLKRVIHPVLCLLPRGAPQHLLYLFRKAAAVALDTCSPLIESNTQASEAPPVLYLRRLRAIA